MSQTTIYDIGYPGRFEDRKEWRVYFTDRQLLQAKLFNNAIEDFHCNDRTAYAKVFFKNHYYTVTIQYAPNSYRSEWDPAYFACTCRQKQNHFVRAGRYGMFNTCEHEAAVLLRWEEQHGPWAFKESDEDYNNRMRKAEIARRKELLEAQKEREALVKRQALDFFPDQSVGGYFDVVSAIRGYTTSEFAINRAKDLAEHGDKNELTFHIKYGSDGGQILTGNAKIGDELGHSTVSVSLGFRGFLRKYCMCSRNDPYKRSSMDSLCEHELVLLREMQDYLNKTDLGDATDQSALSFFRAMDEPSRQEIDYGEQKVKRKVWDLSPKLVIDGGDLSLSFKLTKGEAKGNIIRNLAGFKYAIDSESTYQVSKKLTVDFAEEALSDESLPWLTFLQRRVSEISEVNNRLQARIGYYTPDLKVKMKDNLTGAALDRFYDVAEGSDIACQYNKGKDSIIHVGHADMRVSMRSERVVDQNGAFLGAMITGAMPVILHGSAGSYIIGNGHLSKIDKDEAQALEPFRAAATEGGDIRFRVGKQNLAEFYYRIVPTLLQSKYVDFEDNCAEDAETLLPPEPQFTFQLDIIEYACLCSAHVAYDDNKYRLAVNMEPDDGYHDTAQEKRVLHAIGNYFSKFDSEHQCFWQPVSDDFIYTLLTQGVTELSRYGEVRGSDAFNQYKLRPMPAVQVGVSIESGLMDISVLSKDLSPEELLDVLDSYRKKKRYHKLSGGDFIYLTQNDQIESLHSMLEDIDLNAEDVIGRKTQMPVYRALYLDAILSKHDELAANRDRTYRALIKNFATIRDADYEVPDAQADVLRPYQVYGFKWLRTLTAAGFGGILADEMGLGKTLQAISLLEALKDEGVKGTSLIVCPASLVYNWKEELQKFAPGLCVTLAVGTAAQRKRLIDGISTADVCVTSYDLLRKDIAAFEDIQFTVMILDEAQYIKNQKAGITKAAKAVQAHYRFALTGTPIENRLAELWSIFDFLMPGFLYTYPEFSRRFETPVVKNHDEVASARLRQMTAPFVLRRLKADVLKDLPEKLEEVRYTRFETEQRKIYDGQVVHMKQLLTGVGTAGEDKLKILTELMRIRQICCDPSLLFEDYRGGSAKREACLELIRNAIGGGHRMLVFSQFTSMLELLEEDLRREKIDYFKLTGASSKESRSRMVRQFNESSVPVFLISLKAGGTGLNLTGADVVIHYDPWWNVAAQNQATDRAHRIGQTNQVTVYRLIVKDTIEEKILALQEAKRDLADSIITGEHSALTSMSNEELLDLLG